MTTDYSKAGTIARFAESIRNGTSSRNTRFRWREGWEVPNSTGPSVDITDEVLAAAGPETPEEIEGRAEHETALFPYRLGYDIASDLVDDFCNSWGLHFCGYAFEFDEDAEDEVIIVRPDGKRYRIEIEVHATELPAAQAADADDSTDPDADRTPQPWDVPLPLEVSS